MVVAFYFRLHLAYFPRPVVAIFARPEQLHKNTHKKSARLLANAPTALLILYTLSSSFARFCTCRSTIRNLFSGRL